MKITFPKKIPIIATITFIIVVILDIFFTNLLFGKINSINDKIKQQDISSQARLKEINSKSSIDSSIAERGKLTSYFVNSGDLETVRFTKYLEDIATEKMVTQKKTLNYEPVLGLESSEFVTAIRYKFNVSGQWSNVFAFLQAIENLPKSVSLNSVSFSVNTDNVSIKDINSKGKIWSADIDFVVAKLK